eukprot:m.676119 g.676119  ORF g.676119 m.676119 type:complete len:361 (-) comp22788_c1_seq93:3103-4185(-)
MNNNECLENSVTDSSSVIQTSMSDKNRDSGGNTHAGFLASYRTISSKLKKRFLRKPNVIDAIDQYQQLNKFLQSEGVHQHAAFVMLAAARCHEALNNPTGEAEKVVRAAQLFMEAEMESKQLDFSGFEENLVEAVDCYELAIRIYCKINRTSLAATLHAEVANALVLFGRLEEAASHHENAAALLEGSPAPAIAAYENAMECKIRLQDYSGALELLERILCHLDTMHQSKGNAPLDFESPVDYFGILGESLRPSVYSDIVARSEVSAILLLLHLPEAAQHKHKFSCTLERYRTCGGVRVPYVSHQLQLLMQSVVLAAEVWWYILRGFPLIIPSRGVCVNMCSTALVMERGSTTVDGSSCV